MSPDVIEAHEVYSGIKYDNIILPFKVSNLPINIFITMVATIYSCLWIVSRIRFAPIPAEPYSMMADYIADSSDIDLYPEMMETGRLRLVLRTKKVIKNELSDAALKQVLAAEYNPMECIKTNVMGAENKVADIDYGLVTEGILDFRQGILSVWQTIGDCYKILIFAGKYEPALFYKLISMPHKRIIYRALFRRFLPTIYWGRDPYNPEHIIRRQELNALNGKSWGPLHGYPTYTSIYPMYRYLSYDKLYTVSRHFYEKDYFYTWHPDTVVVDTSTF